MILSTEQQEIFDYNGNSVVIAQPGSGKTFTLSNKISTILGQLPDYKGVVAISYTRKASTELETRCLRGGLDKKGSFFGTMDKFYIVEIVLPFGRHIFGKPSKELEVIEAKDEVFKTYLNGTVIEDFVSWINENITLLKQMYLDGYILLESVSILALFVLENSQACKNYIKSRYTHVVIDEYQDSGAEQHKVFMKLNEIGLTAIAVGDINQSIFGFAKKSSEFLLSLAQEDTFKVFRLTKNYRCHPSIINYSMKLISRDFVDLLPIEETRVFGTRINGTESEIAKWLNTSIPLTMERFGVNDYNEVAILVRGKRTGAIIDNGLTLKHKYFDGTPFDNDTSLWSNVFMDILRFIFDNKRTKYEFAESYFDIELQKDKARSTSALLQRIKSKYTAMLKEELKSNMLQVAELIFPNAYNKNAINILDIVLGNPKLLDNFKPAHEDEVQIMTIHKSKGLEFSIVFHLDLYEYIFPAKRIVNGDFVYPDPIQDKNLHYVGITRAKDCCVLCYSSQRINGEGQLKSGNPSEFMQLPRLIPLRESFVI